MFVPFGDWLPDLPVFSNPGAPKATNVIPHTLSYRPFKGLSAQTNALSGVCRGAEGFLDSSSNIFIYAGDDSKLYESVDLTFTDESKGGGYTVPADNQWEFAQFDTKVIATNGGDAIQSMVIGAGASSAFADLITSTNTPKARHLATVWRFLVLGNTDDVSDGVKTNRVWWSGIDDSTDFDPDATTQSDFEDFKEGGAVTRIVGGADYGLVFQERLIQRMVYVGSPVIFDFQPVDRKRGTPVSGSVVGHGRNVFYWSEEGFQMFDGLQSHPIGDGRVDNTFANQFDITNKKFVHAAVDPLNKLYVIAFPGTGSSGGLPNRLFVCYWPKMRWAEIEVDTQVVLKAFTQGYTLDSLDDLGTDIDDSGVFDESFDSDKWKGGQFRFSAFDSTNKLAFFTGSNLAGIVDTKEIQLIKGRRSLVSVVKPVVEASGSTAPSIAVQPGSRNRLVDQHTYSSSVTINAIGECPVMIDARYHRERVHMPAAADWDHAIGVEFPEDAVKPGGLV
jgi:hypothetical protein